MSKARLLGSTTLAERFPAVMRLLGGTASAETDGDGPGEDDEQQDPPADDPPPPPGDGDDSGGEDGDGQDTNDGSGGDDAGTGEGAAAAAAAGALVGSMDGPAYTRLISAFEADANRLVANERTRCISVFNSDAGRRNPAGAAACLEEGLSAERSIALLGTVSTRDQSRARLRDDPSTRTATGAGREADAGATDVKAAHRERQASRNKTVKNGKRVGAAAVGTE